LVRWDRTRAPRCDVSPRVRGECPEGTRGACDAAMPPPSPRIRSGATPPPASRGGHPSLHPGARDCHPFCVLRDGLRPPQDEEGGRLISPSSLGGRDTRVSKDRPNVAPPHPSCSATRPSASTPASTPRFNPNGSLSTHAARIAPNTIEVSRSAAIGATGALA